MGGVSSPSDKLEDLQFSDEEILAIVDETTRRRTYVMAHAYTSQAISRVVKLGVRCIEHGNYLDDESAVVMKDAGAYLSQTLITYQALLSQGEKCGMPQEQVQKVGDLVTAGMNSVACAKRHGVPVTYGSDLLGAMRVQQLSGFSLLLDSGFTPKEALDTATKNAAELVANGAGVVLHRSLIQSLMLILIPIWRPFKKGLHAIWLYSM